jgi:hypothetical protein
MGWLVVCALAEVELIEGPVSGGRLPSRRSSSHGLIVGWYNAFSMDDANCGDLTWPPDPHRQTTGSRPRVSHREERKKR